MIFMLSWSFELSISGCRPHLGRTCSDRYGARNCVTKQRTLGADRSLYVYLKCVGCHGRLDAQKMKHKYIYILKFEFTSSNAQKTDTMQFQVDDDLDFTWLSNCPSISPKSAFIRLTDHPDGSLTLMIYTYLYLVVYKKQQILSNIMYPTNNG